MQLLKFLAALGILTVWLGPLAAAFLDLVCWFVGVDGCSGIAWTDDGGLRGQIAIWWTILASFFALPLLQVLDS